MYGVGRGKAKHAAWRIGNNVIEQLRLLEQNLGGLATLGSSLGNVHFEDGVGNRVFMPQADGRKRGLAWTCT